MTQTIPDQVARAVDVALAGIGRHYPYVLQHRLESEADVVAPRQLTPIFCGNYDWHSSVHTHWTLVRALRLFPQSAPAPSIAAILAERFSTANVRAELRYLRSHPGFERPYGIAWLLQLVSELARATDRGDARAWFAEFQPLGELCFQRFLEYLPRLTHPVRSGQHEQSAFALGLALDAARVLGAQECAAVIESWVRERFGEDREAPLAYEPSGTDFLSPVCAEADLMRRVLPRDEFVRWLHAFVPHGKVDALALTPVICADPSDGKFAHLDGLNLSRAWMLDGIAAALPPEHPARAALVTAAALHGRVGLASISPQHYAGAHWLPSFAMYWLTRAGLESATGRGAS
ncbi:MAG: DUF2891 domain-containing protein [Planctomycetota bacterium]